MEINDILALTDYGKMVSELQKRYPLAPDITNLVKQYDQEKHDVKDATLRPDKPIKNEDGELQRTEKVARITLALQSLIVKRAVSFLFGNPVKFMANAETEPQKLLFEAVKKMQRKVKINSFNRQVAREIFKATEAAECWYPVKEDNDFYGFPSKFKLRVALFSPANGDLLYPVFDALGDMVAFSREYRFIDADQVETVYFETWTADKYLLLHQEKEGWTLDKNEANATGKIPVIYGHQDKSEWYEVQGLIDRLEKLLSNFADTNDYHASPKIFVTGTVEGFTQKGESGAIIEGSEGATAQYLAWQSAPESVKLEITNLLNMIYTISQTPDISFESLKGMGAVSGVALKLMFMDAHLKVQDKLEIFDEYLQRRANLLKKFASLMNTSLAKELNLEITPEITPYLIGDEKTLVETLVTANGQKPIISQKTSVQLSGMVEDTDAEFIAIQEEAAAAAKLENTANVFEPTE